MQYKFKTVKNKNDESWKKFTTSMLVVDSR
jgi:hypothetical protein